MLRTATWKCGVEALSSRLGSVVGVQQRQWALGGRVQYGSTVGLLQVDRSDLPAFTANAGWTVGVTHPILLRGTATISAIAGLGGGQSLVTFSTPVPAARFMRCTNNAGTEGAISGISRSASGGGSTIVVQAQGPGFAAGQPLSLYDYDVIDAVLVEGLSGTAITTATNFLQAPTPDAPWFYAQSGGDAPYKLFRLTSIKQSGDFQLELSGLDYNPAAYEAVTPVYGAVFSAPQVVADVSGLALTEQLQKTTLGNSKGGLQAYITATWSNGQNTAGADVYGQVDGGIWNHMAHVAGTGYSFLASTGDTWTIKVVGFDRLGVSASYVDGPEATISVQGTGVAPSDVANLTGTFVPSSSGGQTVLQWENSNAKIGYTAPGVPRTGTTIYSGQASFEVRFSSTGNLNWNSAALIATGITAQTYTDTTGRVGTYLVKALSATGIESVDAASWTSLGSSSSYNAQGSVVPSQSINATYALTQASDGSWELQVICPAQPLALSDGTTYATVATTQTWTGLSSSTTFYVYTYINVADLMLHTASGDPPSALPTAPSASIALLASSDGRISGPLLTVTTGAAATGGGGSPITGGGNGGTVCPEASEPVLTRERGVVAVGTVKPGEHLCGWSFTEGCNVWRRIRAVHNRAAESWHVVDGHRVSPQHPVIREEAVGALSLWRMPWSLGAFDRFDGHRVKVELEEDAYDEQNYWLSGRKGQKALLMHNARVSPC